MYLLLLLPVNRSLKEQVLSKLIIIIILLETDGTTDDTFLMSSPSIKCDGLGLHVSMLVKSFLSFHSHNNSHRQQ